MDRLRLHRVLTATLLFAAALAVLVWNSLKPPLAEKLPDAGLQLDQLAAYRYEHQRGMTPCQVEDREITSRARGVLRNAGVSDSGLVAVVAPTFEGTKIMAFGDRQISILSFIDKAGYTAPESWFSKKGNDTVNLEISPRQQHQIVGPLSRQARYASTTQRSGFDGTIYFLDWGGECALTWSPGEDEGPSAFVAQILDELQHPRPSVLKLVRIASAMEANERRIGR